VSVLQVKNYGDGHPDGHSGGNLHVPPRPIRRYCECWCYKCCCHDIFLASKVAPALVSILRLCFKSDDYSLRAR
jgi:hypothetical protein